MALSAILRRTASAVVPVAIHSLGRCQNYHSTLVFSISRQTFASDPLKSCSFSSIAKKPRSDESLLRVIDSEIKCAQDSDDHNRVEQIPGEFPFEIEDHPGEQTISLKREHDGETIKVIVHMPDLVTGDDNNDDGDDDSDNAKGTSSSIPLVVSIDKGNGPSLEFSCTAYADEVAIDSLSVREKETTEDQIAYEGPDFSDLDENLQKAFHKYLAIRGISASTTNFLHEYMINKDSREYLVWLKNVKKFIEK